MPASAGLDFASAPNAPRSVLPLGSLGQLADAYTGEHVVALDLRVGLILLWRLG